MSEAGELTPASPSPDLPAAVPSRGLEFRWPAIAIFAFLAFAVGGLLIPFTDRARESKRRKESAQRLEELGIYSAIYRLKFGGSNATIDIVTNPGKIDDSAFRTCAVCTEVFTYVLPPEGAPPAGAEILPVPVAWCAGCMAKSGRAPVLFQNGKVEEISRDVLKHMVEAQAKR